MNHRPLLATTMAIVLGFSSLAATAQPRDRDERGPGHGQHDRGDRRGGPDRHRDADHRGHGQKARHGNPHDHGRGVGPEHRYHRGDRLPPGLRTRHYVVEDWRGHRLSAPPRGYRWLQVDSDYVLIAVATGLIAQIVLSN
ncbi:RcnB family protein [Pseudorhodoferax sp. Leaf267]|uniref:RcnB family protein n=1 Tax=Pseudorhodoferax sp. Leaf267 TaxID=1736316 RepID=UPI0009E6CDEF|nr:RcnB family protein [Pseudorhodoferax sp. Leaf267]